MSKSSSIFPQVLTRSGLVLLIFFLIGSVTYLNTLNNPFEYDDDVVVVKNVNIREIGNIPRFFFDPSLAANDPKIAGHYRPLVITSYAINYTLGGLSPVGYHLVNLAFHVGSAFLVFLIVSAMSGGMGHGAWAALAAGLIFLVHPFNAEAVNYITARSSLMSGFFYLMGFYCWVRFRGQASGNYSSTVFYSASLLAFAAGMLSKEVVITLPIVFWLYDLYFTLRPAPRTLLNWRTYISYLPFVFIVVIPYIVIRISSFGGVLPHFKRDIWTQIFTALPVLILHWKMFLIPVLLTPVHYVKIYSTFWSFPVISSSLILTGYAVIAILLLRSSSYLCKVVSFFMSWFFIVLLPTAIIPLNAIFQENRGYLAVVSFVVLAGVAIGELEKIRLRKVGVVLLVFLIVIYSALVFQRNRVWKDELTLWSDTVQKVPQSPLGFTALGVAYQRLGMYNNAFDAYHKALILGGESNFIVHDSVARIYMTQKKWDMAAQSFEKAILAFSNKAETHHDLAVAYFRMDRLDLSEKHFKEAAGLNPKHYKSYYNMGVLYTKKGMLEEAAQAYQKSLSLSPGDLKLRLNLGTLLEDLGKKGEAVEQYRIVAEQAGKDEKGLSVEAGRHLERLKQYNIKTRREENGREEHGK